MQSTISVEEPDRQAFVLITTMTLKEWADTLVDACGYLKDKLDAGDEIYESNWLDQLMSLHGEILEAADEIERLRALLTEHVVLAEYPRSGDAPKPSGYICQICNGKGDEPNDLIHMGDCPLYDAEKDATEAGTVD